MARAGFAGRRRKSGPEHLNSSGTWVFGLYDATMLSRLSERFLSVACTIAGEDEECSTIATARCYLRECAVLVIFTALRKGSMAGSCVGSTLWCTHGSL